MMFSDPQEVRYDLCVLYDSMVLIRTQTSLRIACLGKHFQLQVPKRTNTSNCIPVPLERFRVLLFLIQTNGTTNVAASHCSRYILFIIKQCHFSELEGLSRVTKLE